MRANENDRPEFTYWVRVANGFTFESVRALQAWRGDPEVRRFLDRLPPEGKKQLKKVSGVAQKMGPGALEEMRNQTFHYPRPEPNYNPDSADRLHEILKAEEEAEVEMDQLDDGSICFTFADSLALGLAIGTHYPPTIRASSAGKRSHGGLHRIRQSGQGHRLRLLHGATDRGQM